MGQIKNQYSRYWNQIKGDLNAHATAVGGDFETMGTLEFALLQHAAGLTPDSSVIDVGCGSGRLAVQLSRWLRGPYLGTDVLPELLDHAKQLCDRPDWRFAQIDSTEIPAPDASADIVCFFSVFTHLPHEDSYRYLLEAKRVLRAGGRIVCSFLEFRMRNHWAIFREDLKVVSPDKLLNQFMGRDAFEAFAFNADLRIASFFDGDKPHIPIDGELVFENGYRVSGLGNLGQSVCILEKPVS